MGRLINLKGAFFVMFRPIVKVFHLFYSYKTNMQTQNIKSKLYSLWIMNSIGKSGKSSRIGRNCYLQGGKSIEIGENTSIGRNSVLSCWEERYDQKFESVIKIGSNCSIGEYVHITSVNSIVIGDGVLTGRFVTISDNSHGANTSEEIRVPPQKRKMHSKGPVVIGDNVWIGDKVTILAGVSIGEGAIIAANAVVTRDIPDFSVAGGVPAKVIKTL